MKICKAILDNFRNDSILDLFFQHLKIYVFNMENNNIRLLDNIQMLTCLAKSDILLMPEDNEALLELPYPKKVTASMFMQPYLRSSKRHVFNRLIFIAKISNEKLSIWYNEERIYEEPIFLMLQGSVDVEDGMIFDDRIEYLRTALKDVYGKKAILQCESTYPAISATKDLWFYFSEQIAPVLEKHGYSLINSLDVMLAVTAKAEDQAAFMAYVSSDVGSVEEVIDTLFNEYIKYCGVSKGYRTVIWDSMVAIYSYFKPKLSHEAIQAMLHEHFKSDQFEHIISYDLAIITPLDSMNYQMQLFIRADECLKKALALGLICFVHMHG